MALKRTHIMLHHSLTSDGQTVSWGAIEDYHRSWRDRDTAITAAKARELIAGGATWLTPPWADIGYHFGIEQIAGRNYTLVGRGLDQAAAACPQGNMNRLAFHVMFTGNFDLGPPIEAMLELGVRRCIVPLMRQFGIPIECIVRHHDFNPLKTCPGTQFDIERVRALVRKAGP